MPELRPLHPSARSLLLWSLSTCRALIVPPYLPQFQQLPGPSFSGACPLAELSVSLPVFPSFSSCQVPPSLEPVHLQSSQCPSLSSPVSAAARSGACPLAELSLSLPVFPSFSSCQVPPPLEPVHLQSSHCPLPFIASRGGAPPILLVLVDCALAELSLCTWSTV